MNRFLQIHMLTFVPPANLNRDDTGRPKTAVVGGAQRLRLSSQALKRAWRSSPVFKTALEGHQGERTSRLGDDVLSRLLAGGMDRPQAVNVARGIAEVFGKLVDSKNPNPARIEQLAFVGPEERGSAMALADRALAGETVDPKSVVVLQRTDSAADIAMFGRMLAAAPDYNRDAAVQVSHAITTHAVAVEDDFYTAVDDLKRPSEDAGAGFVGEAGFASGVFYMYVCVDRTLLVRNLGGDASLAATALGALAEAAATALPSGKQNSFAAHGRAGFILAESGDQQPRTLAGAFSVPVRDADQMGASISALERFRGELETAYGPAAEAVTRMKLGAGGSLSDVVAFARV